MCSIVEDEFENEGSHAMIEDILLPQEIALDEICKKCKLEKVLIKLNLKDGKCKECFIAYVVHKFRASLGSTKIVRRGADVLLNFDGSPASVCLLHMYIDSAKELHKKLDFKLHLIYIDEILSPEINSSHLQNIQVILDQFKDIICYYVNLGSRNELRDMRNRKTNGNNEEFLGIFKSIQSLTAKQEFVSRTKTNQLYKAANDLNCQYIFYADIGIDLAKTMLSNISLGRTSVAHDVQFCDDRNEDIKIIRPVRDLTLPEINHYLRLMNLNYLNNVKSFGADNGSSASIQNLTSAFVDGLQKNFSSTISTVFKTGDKIKHSTSLSNIHCVFCNSSIDYKNSSALFAIEYSRLVSADAQNHVSSDSVEKEAEKAVNGDLRELQKKLCHSCRNIFTGIEDEEVAKILQ